MLEAVGRHLKRGVEIEDGLAALNRLDPAGGDGLAVADILNVIDDGTGHIPRTQEVGVKTVNLTAGLNRLLGG